MRVTKQRQAISELLNERTEFASAQTLHDELRARGHAIGLTTVYRNLAALADAGDVDVLTQDDGETLYRKCSSEHHHHLVCRSCGATAEVSGDAVELWAERVAAEHGFTAVDHTFELVGLCARCSAP